MNTDYLNKLYDWIGQNDESFSANMSLEQFNQKMQDPAYSKKMHDWIGSVDETFVQNMPLDEFQGKVGNIQPQEESLKKKEVSDTTVSPSADTSLASPSPENDSFSKALNQVTPNLIDLDEEDAVVKFNDIFREQGFKFEQTGVGDNINVIAPNGKTKSFGIDMWTSGGDQQVAGEVKDWMQKNKREFSTKKAEVSESDFSKSAKTITPDLISSDEDYVIPQLQDMFKDYGFDFSTTTVGDNVVVTAPNKKTLTIPVDQWTDKGNAESASQLRNFIKANKSVIPKLTEEYNQYESRIRSEDDLKNVKQSFNSEVSSLRGEQSKAVIENAWLNKESASLDDMDINTAEYTSRIGEYNKRLEAYNQNIKKIAESEKGIESKAAKLDASVGRYTAMSEKQGQFWEGLGLSALGAYGSFSASVTGIMADIGGLVGGAPFSYSTDSKRFVELALKKNIDVPQQLLVSPDKWTKETSEEFKAWHKSLGEDEKNSIESKISDEHIKEIKGEVLPVVRTALTGALKSGETKEEYLRSGGFMRQSIYGLAASAPSMVAGGPVARTFAFGLQGYDGAMQEMSSPEFDDISENEKYMVALPIAIVNGVLEEYGFRNTLGKSGVVNNIVARVISKSAAKTSAKTFKELVENEVEGLAARGLLTATAAALSEAETGGTQAAAEIGIKHIFNAVNEKEMFQTPKSVTEWFEQVGESAAMEAVGGLIMGVPSSVSTAISKNNYNGVTDADVKMFSLMANDENYKTAYVLKIKEAIVSGKMDSKKGNDLIESYDKGVSAINAMPENLNDAGKRKALSLLIEEKELENKIEGKNKALVKKEQERLNEINNELVELSKLSENAIQEPSTEEGVLRQEGPQVGLQQVGEGDQVAAEGTEAIPTEETQKVTETILSTPQTTMVALETLPTEDRMSTTFIQEDGTETPVMGNENMLADLYHQAVDVADDERTPSQQSVVDAVEVSLKTQLEEEAQVQKMQEMDRQAPTTVSETTQSFAHTQVSGAADVSNDADMQDIQDRVSVNDNMKNTVIKAAKMAHKTLTSLFPDFKIYLHTDSDAYDFLMQDLKGKKGTGGNFAVYRNTDGKIVGGRIDINLNQANLRTVAHEVTHAVLLKAFGDNPKLFNSFKNRLSVVIKSSDNVALNKFIAGYKNANVRPEEYLAELTAILSANERTIEPTVMQRILAVINDFIKRISGDKIAQFKNTAELMDFVNTISQKIAAGEEISLKESETNKSKGEAIVSKSQTNETKPTTKSGNRLFNEPLKAVTEIADRYYERVFGQKRPKYFGTRGLDEARAKKIADSFINMKHEPNNPEVRKAYNAMAEESIAQYKTLLDAGYHVEINNDEPYGNSQEMIDDLRNNNRMKIFSTESGFGDTPITDAQREENPLLKQTEFKDINGQPLLVNDLFRAIHDFFGHAELGNSFGPKGEENAWNVHIRMFGPLAARAMTTETRGQNSFVNFSGINDTIEGMRDEARKLREQGKEDEAQAIVQKIYDEFKFADQKIGLLPEQFSDFDVKDEGTASVPTAKLSINEKINTIGDTPKPVEVKSKSQVASKGDNLVPEDWNIDKDGNGNFVFYHYGDVKEGQVSPNFHGKNIYTSDKRANKVAYFYTKGGDKERMISGDPFVVKVPENKVYPFNKDPLNFYDKAEAIFKKEHPYRTFDPVSQIDYMNPLISKAGYDIVVAKWEAFPLRAESMKPLQYDKNLTKQFRSTGTVTSKSQVSVGVGGDGKWGSQFKKDKYGLAEILNENIPLVSDRMRGEYLINSAEKIDTEDLSKAPRKLLTQDNDFVYVKETPTHLVLTEEWTSGSKKGLYDKYGDSSPETIEKHIVPRFKKLADILGLEFVSHELDGKDSVVILKKPKTVEQSIKETPQAVAGEVKEMEKQFVTSKSQQSASQAKKTIDGVIKDARAQGFSENAIRTFLQKKGLTSDEVDLAMGREKGVAAKINITEETMPGYDRVVREIEGIVAKSNERGASEKKTIQNVMDYLMGTKLYENATDVQREQLVRNISQAFGIKLKSAPSVDRILGNIKDIKKVTMNEMDLLNKQFKDIAKGAKDATVAFMKASAQLSKAIKQMRSEGKITVGQAANILRKFGSVNMFNEESIAKFVKYMSKVFSDAEYADKISSIKKMLPVAKRNIVTKLGISKSLIPSLKSMLAVKPEMIPDSVFDTYQQLVEMLGKREQVLTLKDVNQVTDMANEVLDAMNEEYSQADELKDVFSDYDNKVFDEDGKLMFADTLAEMVKDNTITNEEAEILKKYKSLVVEKAAKVEMTEQEIAEEKEMLIEGLKNSSINPDALPSENERKLAERIKDFIASGIAEKLTNEQLKNLMKVVDNINNGYLPHYAQVLVERMNSLSNSGFLSNAITLVNELPLTKLYARFKSIFFRDKNYLDLMIGRSPLYYIDQIFGNFKGKEIFNSLFKQAAIANSLYEGRMSNIQDRLGNALENVSKSFSNNANEVRKSSYRMMAYALQLEHDSNPGAKGVYPAADFLKATIKHILAGKSHLGEADAKMLQEILNNEDFKDADGNISAERLYESFNNAEIQALDAIKKINESVQGDAEFTSSVIRGDNAKMISNYVHHNVMPDSKPDENISGITSANTASENMRPSSRGKSLIERTTGVKPLDFNIFSATQRGANYVMMDYYLTEPIRTARKTIIETENALMKDKIDKLISDGMSPEEARQEATLGKKDQLVLTALNDAFEKVLNNILVNKMSNNSFADEVANYITKQGYRAVLASTVRWTSELSGNLGYVLMVDPVSYAQGWSMHKDIIMSELGPQVLEAVESMNSERIYSSESLSGRMVDQSILSQASGIKGGKAKGDVANAIQTIYNNSLKKGLNFVEATADALITTPDKIMMRPLWFGSFGTEFKKITGEDVDFKKIAAKDEDYMKEFKEAISKSRDAADNASIMAGASDNAFMGVLKGTVQPNSNNLAKAFNVFNNYMTKFMIYEFVTARTGIYAAIGQGTISKKQGVALLAGVTTRTVLYTLLMNVLGSALVKMATGQEDDDEDEKSFLQKTMQAFASGVSGLMLGRDFGNATKTLVNYGIEKVNEKYLDFLRKGEYDPYKDAIQYSSVPKDKVGKTASFADFLINMSGPMAPSLKTTQLIFNKMTEQPKKEEAAIERSKKEWNIRIPLEIAGNAGLVPIYKDVRKAVLANIYKDLKNADKEAAAKKETKEEKLRGYENQTDMKRYDPKLYEEVFGKNAPDYDIEQSKNALKKEMENIKRQIKDEAYGYTPKEKEKKKEGGFVTGQGVGTDKKKKGGFSTGGGFLTNPKPKTTGSSSSFIFERGK
jgi:hypothetical protein